MRRVAGWVGWVALVLFAGPVLSADPAGTTIAGWVLGATAGVAALMQLHHRLTVNEALLVVGAVTTGAYWCASALYGPSMLWVALWFVVCTPVATWWALNHRGAVKTSKGVRWWTEPNLIRAFTTAGILKPVKGDEDPVRMPAKVARDDYGTTVTVKLPPGVSFSRVEGKREQLAAALGKPQGLVTVTQTKTDPANVATVRVAVPVVRTTRDHTMPSSTSWRDPITVARDRRNRDVTIPTWNTGQILVGGRTGSGKTRFLWLVASHFALDPTATLYVADGKGSTDDWGPLRHRCERLVFVHDESPGFRFMELLTEVQDLVTDRNKRGGRDWPGVLVILEEFSSMLATLDTAAKRDAERAVGRLTQTCRSANVLVVIAAQRPAASVMDTTTRAQAAASVAFAMKSATDTTMVLGHTPAFDLPTEPGEAIIVVPGKDDAFVDLDYIEDDAWAELCASLPSCRPDPVWLPEEEPVVATGRTVAVTYDPPLSSVERDEAGAETARALYDEEVFTPVPDDAPVVELTAREAVLATMTSLGADGATVRTGRVVEVSGFSRSTAALALKELVAAGELVQPGRGEYTLPSCVTTPDVRE